MADSVTDIPVGTGNTVGPLIKSMILRKRVVLSNKNTNMI